MPAQQLLTAYRLTAADLGRVRQHGELVVSRMDRFVEKFYEWMRTLPEFEQFFTSPKKLAMVQNMQRDY